MKKTAATVFTGIKKRKSNILMIYIYIYVYIYMYDTIYIILNIYIWNIYGESMNDISIFVETFQMLVWHLCRWDEQTMFIVEASPIR